MVLSIYWPSHQNNPGRKRKGNRSIWGIIPGFTKSKTCIILTHFWDNRIFPNCSSRIPSPAVATSYNIMCWTTYFRWAVESNPLWVIHVYQIFCGKIRINSCHTKWQFERLPQTLLCLDSIKLAVAVLYLSALLHISGIWKFSWWKFSHW